MAKPKVTSKLEKQSPDKSVRQDSASIQTTMTSPNYASPCVNIEEIRRSAYLKWEAAGKPDCDGTSFWLAAEQESHSTPQNW